MSECPGRGPQGHTDRNYIYAVPNFLPLLLTRVMAWETASQFRAPLKVKVFLPQTFLQLGVKGTLNTEQNST